MTDKNTNHEDEAAATPLKKADLEAMVERIKNSKGGERVLNIYTGGREIIFDDDAYQSPAALKNKSARTRAIRELLHHGFSTEQIAHALVASRDDVYGYDNGHYYLSAIYVTDVLALLDALTDVHEKVVDRKEEDDEEEIT
jgi:hypothetical protein